MQVDKLILAAPWNSTTLPLGNTTGSEALVDYVPVHVTFFTSPRKLTASALHGDTNVPGRILPSGHALFSIQGIREMSFVKTIPRRTKSSGDTEYKLKLENLYRALSHTKI